MNISEGVVDVIARTADVTMAASGAVGGAAVNGLIAGVRGAAVGVKNGTGSGSHWAPAAALALSAVDVAGLVDCHRSGGGTKSVPKSAARAHPPSRR